MVFKTNIWLSLRIFIAKLTISFLFLEMKGLGLVAYQINYKTREAKLLAWKVVYSVLICSILVTFYGTTELFLLTDRNLEYFYAGVSLYVLIVTGTLAIILIIVFYCHQIYYRKDFAEYHNILREDYNSFFLFYGNRIRFDSSDQKFPENIREIDFVYMPLFLKMAIHLIIIATHVMISTFIDMIFPGETFIPILIHLLIPYVIQSCTSSYLFLASKKVSFLYKEMAKKMTLIREEIIVLAKSNKARQFEKITAFCELSDQIDSMAISFHKITRMGMNLANHYGIHMLFILGYSVFTSLVMLFFQYMGLAHHARGLFTYDARVAITTMGFIVLNVLEILITINVVEDAERRCRRVAKEIHLINYWQHSFDVRLKQSVRI